MDFTQGQLISITACEKCNPKIKFTNALIWCNYCPECNETQSRETEKKSEISIENLIEKSFFNVKN